LLINNELLRIVLGSEPGTCWPERRFIGMTPVTEHEVAVAASFMGYDLWRAPQGYLLKRQWHNEEEVVAAPSLELIAEFLKH
jgi:hypothetical protein